MKNANLYALFQKNFPQDETAACFISDEGACLSYSDVDRESGRLAGMLRKLNIAKDSRIVMQVEKSPVAVMVYLACLRAGVVFIPLNTAYTSREVRYFLENAAPDLLVCMPSSYDDLVPVARECGVAHVLTLDAMGQGSLMDQAERCEVDPEVAIMGPDETAAILYTSGTTGLSKGAMLTHENLSSNALALHDIWGWVPGDVLLHVLPIFHAHGLFVGVHLALLNGSPMIFLPKFDVERVLHHLPQATVLMGVPTFYSRLVDSSDFSRDCCENMRLFISGSAPLRPETFRAFEARTGMPILERYGMTEAIMITSNPLNGDRVAGTVGYALPGVSVRVVGNDGVVLPAGSVGELEIKGPNIFKGYWRMPEKTREEFTADGFFKTGDLSIETEDGRVSIVGRNKDLVISGGYNVYPKEIEQQIDQIEGVSEAAVIGLPHPDFGEAVTAVVVCERDHAISEEAILNGLKQGLAKFKQPKRVFIVAELPRNAMGKIQKNILRDRYATTFTGREAS